MGKLSWETARALALSSEPARALTLSSEPKCCPRDRHRQQRCSWNRRGLRCCINTVLLCLQGAFPQLWGKAGPRAVSEQVEAGRVLRPLRAEGLQKHTEIAARLSGPRETPETPELNHLFPDTASEQPGDTVVLELI